jgi:hypothetical protein
MSWEDVLRTTLEQEADREPVPELRLPDLLDRGRRAERRAVLRRRLTSLVAVLLVVTVALVLGATWVRHDSPPREGATTPDRSQRRELAAFDVPYCLPAGRTAAGDGDILHVGGVDVPTRCAQGDGRRLWYHAGVTLRLESGRLERITRQGVVPLGSTPDEASVTISEGGRYVVWTDDSRRLVVDDLLDDGDPLHVAPPVQEGRPGGPGSTTRVWGVDALGRVYVGPDASQEAWLYSIPSRRWIGLTGLPAAWSELSYLHGNTLGFAVRRTPGHLLEGQVTFDGVFVPVRTITYSKAFWAPDESAAVVMTGDRLWVEPTTIGDRVELDVPLEEARDVRLDVQWASRGAVLLSEGGTGVLNCSVGTGQCHPIPGIELPLSPQAPLPG